MAGKMQKEEGQQGEGHGEAPFDPARDGDGFCPGLILMGFALGRLHVQLPLTCFITLAKNCYGFMTGGKEF